MEKNYFLVDGSALQAQIRHLWRAKAVPNKARLCIRKFMDGMVNVTRGLHDGSYKRAVFYFPSGDDESVQRHIIIPEFGKRGEARDIIFKFCGQKLKRSSDFDEFVEKDVPDKWKSRFSKSEKGIDIEICCDAFKLASFGSVERIFLLTNDDDFTPFCRVIKDFGCNISIIHLTDLIPPNATLIREADSYDALPPDKLADLFEGGEDEPPVEIQEEAEGASLKADAEASALIVNDAVSKSTVSQVDLETKESDKPKAK